MRPIEHKTEVTTNKKSAAKRPSKKRKTQDQLLLEAAERNKNERKAGKPQTIEIFC